MNLFFRSKIKTPITVDIHSHLLPGIDDGVQSIKESISLIKKFHLLGYTKLITTPHIISDSYPNTQEIISEKLYELTRALEDEEIDISIEASAEYYVDMEFLALIEDDKLIPFMGHYILFETSYYARPIILEKIIFDIQKKGYIPVLAHPERYFYLHSNIQKYQELKQKGVLFQLNAKSLIDKSKRIYKIATKLINAELIDFVGSDAHRMHDMKKLEKVIQSKEYRKLLKKNTILNNN